MDHPCVHPGAVSSPGLMFHVLSARQALRTCRSAWTVSPKVDPVFLSVDLFVLNSKSDTGLDPLTALTLHHHHTPSPPHTIIIIIIITPTPIAPSHLTGCHPAPTRHCHECGFHPTACHFIFPPPVKLHEVLSHRRADSSGHHHVRQHV